MFQLGAPYWQVILRTGMVYLVLLLGLRLVGKREVGQMTLGDLVVLLLLSNAVQNAMVGPDTSVTGGLIAVAVLLALNFLITRLTLRSPKLRRLIEGSPTLLILHGEVLQAHMQQEGITLDRLEASLREHGIGSIAEAEMAVLETDGSISVIASGVEVKRTTSMEKRSHSKKQGSR